MGARQQELAIFIRQIENQAQFYTRSGRWVHRLQSAPKFFVPDFIKPDELLPLLPYLPTEAIPQEELEKLHSFSVALPRDVGRPIISQMTKFWEDADTVYQNSFERLDKAHEILAHPERFSYATLEQISEKLLSRARSVKRDEDGTYPLHALYAVHRKILGEDIGFHPQNIQVIRTGSLYEIVSKAEMLATRRVMGFVREYRSAASTRNYKSCIPYVNFLKKARRRIDFSRTFRDFTIHGTVGPSKIQFQEDGEHYRAGRKGEPWEGDDFIFLDFMESWSCLENFDRSSSLAGIGSEILRALGRYRNPVELDGTTAFTFLKEVGMIPPWENKAAYVLRLPYTGRRLGVEYGYTPHTGYNADRLAPLRKDWENMPVYCIDDHNAAEIDDGISLEATENPDEYWIHVHVADPAAHMDPKGAASQYAEYVTETIYFPERRIPMLHEGKVSQDLSLAPNRPCLTFSSKMNSSGEVTETAITPGIVRNVVFIEPGVVKKITTNASEEKYKSYGDGLGGSQTSIVNKRPLSAADTLSEAQKNDLIRLFQYTVARNNRLQSRGGVSLTPRRASVHVSFDGAPWTKPKPTHSYWHYGDPKIGISVPVDEAAGTTKEHNVVASCMLLAGECAARWCADRGLPIVYRITPQQPDKDPGKYYKEHLKPYRDRDEVIPVEVLTGYFNTIGKVQPSTVSGPHLGIGADVMTRCTSPLRRYTDLITLWQIEAGLVEEANTGKSLIGNRRDDFLPFTKARLDSMLPRIASREKFISHTKTRADNNWTLQFLLYAWKFDMYKLPSPLYYQIRSINRHRGSGMAGGQLVDLAIGGQMLVPPWLDKEDVKINDVFEVEIGLIDVAYHLAMYNPIRRVETEGRAVNESAADLETSEPNTSEMVALAAS